MKRLFSAAIAACFAMPAVADQCAPYGQVVASLSDRWGEQISSRGVSADGTSLVEVHGNPETGSWTIIAVSPTGIACLLAAGEGFTAFRLPPNV